MTTVETGHRAETAATDFLETKGCTIVERNWRTRQCEIDIVAERDQTLYFVEVKYRANSRQGSGLDYITPKKLQHMRFAAESWVHMRGWRGQYQLCAIEVGGPAFTVTAAVKDL